MAPVCQADRGIAERLKMLFVYMSKRASFLALSIIRMDSSIWKDICVFFLYISHLLITDLVPLTSYVNFLSPIFCQLCHS